MSSSITFETTVKVELTKVLLDGKHVGNIKQAKGWDGWRYQYIPKGSKRGGTLYHSLEECKQSLTGE